MSRRPLRLPDVERVLQAARRLCLSCGRSMRIRDENRRMLVTLSSTQRLRLKIRRCEAEGCARFRKPDRPKAEGALALPQQEFGLDVMARVGALRHRDRRSVPEITRDPTGSQHAPRRTQRDQPVRSRRRSSGRPAQQSVAPAPAVKRTGPDRPGPRRPAARCRPQGALGAARLSLRHGAPGAQPASCTAKDLAALLREGVEPVGVPVAGVISDGQHSNCKAVATVRLEVPHQLCHFHFLREAALPIFEADRHAKKKLKKAVRGVRPIERAAEGRRDAEADLVRGYAGAVRSAITDDGRAPLDAVGLRLKERWEKVAGSLERVRSKGGHRGRSRS